MDYRLNLMQPAYFMPLVPRYYANTHNKRIKGGWWISQFQSVIDTKQVMLTLERFKSLSFTCIYMIEIQVKPIVDSIILG